MEIAQNKADPGIVMGPVGQRIKSRTGSRVRTRAEMSVALCHSRALPVPFFLKAREYELRGKRSRGKCNGASNPTTRVGPLGVRKLQRSDETCASLK